jgi:hypothetical protein
MAGFNDEEHAVRNGFHSFHGLLQGCPADCDGPPVGCWPAGGPFEPDHSHYNWTKVDQDAPATTATISTVTGQWSGSVTAADAISWINTQPEPFFAYVAFNPPHQPLERPPDALLDPLTVQELDDACVPPGSFDTAEETRLLYRAMLEATDTNIGQILDSLSVPTRERTIVFVVADNGTYNFGGAMHPSHNSLHGKGSVYQWGVRVPMIVSDPSFPPSVQNQASDALVCASDLWRTIAKVAGASIPQATYGFSCADTEFDSVSFYPVLQNPASAGNRTYAFSQKFTPNHSTIGCRCMHERATSNALYRFIRKQVVKGGMPTGCPSPCDPHSYQVPDELYAVTDREEATNLNDGSLTPDETTNLNALLDAMINLSGSGN